MTLEKLFELRNSSQAPFDHMEYTVWLHNKIIEDVKYSIWKIREGGDTIKANGYAICNKIIASDCLKPAE